MNVNVRVEGAVMRLCICAPPLNIITTEMLLQMEEGLRRADDDADVRVVRIEAEGKYFSAGVDIADHEAVRVGAMMEALEKLFLRFEAINLPTVSVVRGAALGGGCEIALATDLCFAAEGAKFGQPEIKLGLVAPPASVLLPRRIGERRALQLLLTGEAIDARTAASIGLINDYLPADSLEARVDRLVERLAGHSRAALTLAKRAVRAGRDGSIPEAHRRVNELYSEQLMTTADAHEGVRAFLEKRPPVWQHR